MMASHDDMADHSTHPTHPPTPPHPSTHPTQEEKQEQQETNQTMGSYLDKPITEKENYESEAHGLKFGAAAMQGWRVEMEDAHTIIETIGESFRSWMDEWVGG